MAGESGCGKSTLGRLLTIDWKYQTQESYQGQNLHKDKSAEKITAPKDPNCLSKLYGSLNPRKKVGQMLEEPLLINTTLSVQIR